MPLIDKLKESNLEEKDSILLSVNKLVADGVDETTAFKQVLEGLKEEVLNDLETLYNQIK